MKLTQCEKCGRGFFPEEKESSSFPLVSGRSVYKREKDLPKCPYCGKTVEKHVFCTPL